MANRYLGVVASVFVAACAVQPPIVSPIDATDGINESEATSIATTYLREHLAASVNFTGPRDEAGHWAFDITGDAVPFILEGVPPVLVQKQTGVVTWDENPLKIDSKK